MAILGKVAGTMLKDNLLRNGVDLIIDGNLMYYDVVNRRVGIGTVTPGNVLTVNGATTFANIFANNNVLTSLNGNLILNAINGNINANNLRITNIGTPVSNTDAVSKAYVDTSVIALSSPNLTISNSSTTTNVILNSETLVLAGTANQIVSTISENSVTFSLPANVVANSSFIATNQMIGYHTGAIGANVPNSGAFTTLTVSGAANINTMTAATIAASTIGNSGTTLTGTLSTAAQTNITSVGTLTSLAVSGAITTGSLTTSGGGQLTGYHTGAIGANTPNTGVFTTVTTSGGGQLIGYVNGAIGANTANSGAFTTLTATGNVNLDSGVLFVDSVNNRVGVNTTTPLMPLSVFSLSEGIRVYPTNTNHRLRLYSGEGGNYLSGDYDANSVFNITYTSSPTNTGLKFEYGTRNATISDATYPASLQFAPRGTLSTIPALYLDKSGNVGISNSSPLNTLSVNGNVFIQNTLTIGSSISAIGIIYANGGVQGAVTGSFNGTVGSTTPNTVVATSVTTSSGGQITGYHTGAIGANTPNSGAFTTVSATSSITANTFTGIAVYANTIGNTGATIVGLVGTNSQPYITSVGTLTGLAVSGNSTVASVTSVTNGQFIGYHTGAIGANVPNTGAFTNVTMSGTANINTMTASTIAAATIGNTGTSLTGTLTTASQTNITAVGTLGSLNVTANISAGNLRSNGQVTGYLNGVIGANAPNSATFTNLVVANTLTLNGNSVLTTSNIGNFSLFQNTITVTNTDGNINLTPNGNGFVSINSTQALILPVGNNLNRPAFPTEGMIRFNTASNVLEMYDGVTWQAVSSTIATTIVSDSFIGDGSTTTFTLSQVSTTGGTLVTINGIIQIPDVAYSITGTSLQFVEAPVSTDIIEARILTTTSTITAIAAGNASISFGSAANGYPITLEVGSVDQVVINDSTTTFNNRLVTGNIIPKANVLYNLGNSSYRFNDLWLAGTTLYLGSITLKDTNGSFGVYDSTGNTPIPITSAQTSVNGVPIGNSSPNSGVFTTLVANSITANAGGQIRGYFTGAIGANTPNTVVATSVTTSSGGQITGYHTGAIGANVANTGAFTTLTASGNVNIDSGTLFTDSVNNRVGIGNTAPVHMLSVTGNAAISTSLTIGTGIFWPNGNAFTSGITYTASASSPTSPRTGDQWYDTSSDILYTRVNDGTNNYWLDISTFPSTFGNVNVAGNLTISGNVNSHVIPSSSNLFTLGSTTRYWSTIYGVSVNALYADLAEKYASDVELSPGEVVVFGGNKEITKTSVEHDDRVAGIVSTNPAYIMNSGIDGYPIALQGRVPCWVQGPVVKGQMLVTSNIPGVAAALDKSKYQLGCVVGKSLEDIESDEIKMIEVVVGRL